MQELEKILEEINEEIKSSIAFSSVFTDGLCMARNIIINHLSRESTQEITRSSRDSQFGECSQREVYMKAYEDALNEDGVSEEFLEDCRRTAQKYKKDNDGWIPVQERLPEEKKSVLVQWEKYDRHLNVTLTYLDVMWLDDADEKVFETINGVPNGKVIAWRPLPEPYRPERSGNED